MKEGEKNWDVCCLDLGNGYMGIYACENSLSYTLMFVHFIVCISVEQIKIFH